MRTPPSARPKAKTAKVADPALAGRPGRDRPSGTGGTGRRHQGIRGGYAASDTGSGAWLSPGYQRWKSLASWSLRTRVRTCSSGWAPRGCPAHLLFLDHALADHLVDRGLSERGGDDLASAVALPVVRDPAGVRAQVGIELAHCLEQPDLLDRGGFGGVEVEDQVIDGLQGAEDVAV